MANKDKDKDAPINPMSPGFTTDDIAKDAGGTPRLEKDARGAKPSHESDQMYRDAERARTLQVGQGGPFSKARIDPTETDDGLAARGYGAKVRGNLRGASAGYRLVRTLGDGTYRLGHRVPGGVIVEVPKDEPHARWMEELEDQQNLVAVLTLPKLPKLSEEDKQRAEAEKKRQEKIRNAADTIAAIETTQHH